MSYIQGLIDADRAREAADTAKAAAEQKPTTITGRVNAYAAQVGDSFKYINNADSRASALNSFNPELAVKGQGGHFAQAMYYSNHGANVAGTYAMGLSGATTWLSQLDTKFGYDTRYHVTGHQVIRMFAGALDNTAARIHTQANTKLQALNHQNMSQYNDVLQRALTDGKSPTQAHLTAFRETLKPQLLGQQFISAYQLASIVDTLIVLHKQAITRYQKLQTVQQKYNINLTAKQYQGHINKLNKFEKALRADFKAGNITQEVFDKNLARVQEAQNKARYKKMIAGQLVSSGRQVRALGARLTIAQNKVSWFAQTFKGAAAPTAKQKAQVQKAKATLRANSLLGSSTLARMGDMTGLTSFISKLMYVPSLGVMWASTIFGLSNTKMVQNILSMPILGDKRLAVAAKTSLQDKTVETGRVLGTIGAGGILAGLASKVALGALAVAGWPALVLAGAIGIGSFLVADKATEGVFGIARTDEAERLLGNLAQGKSFAVTEAEDRLRAINSHLFTQSAEAGKSQAPAQQQQQGTTATA